MLKNLGFIFVGLAVGLVVMLLTQPQDSPAPWFGDGFDADGGPLPYDAGVRSEAEARITALEERVTRLEGQRPAVAPAPAAGPATLTRVPPISREAAPETIARNAPQPDPPSPEVLAAQAAAFQAQRLINAGFAPERAEWVRRKADELRMEELQARYEAQRNGTVWPANELDASFVDRRLRAEMGDGDYERYLRAYGRSTSVRVNDVYAGSPAATAGMLPGDSIVSYGGKRVFDQNELNAFILEGTPGESVVVEVDRNGRRMQLVVPRGPMGVMGSGTLNVRSAQGILNDLR